MSNPVIDSINTIVNGGINNAPYDYTRNAGVVKNNNDGTCEVRLDNKNYVVPVYGYFKEIHSGDVVKLIVPENNMNKAFILPRLYEPPTIPPIPHIPSVSYDTGKIEIDDILIQWGITSITTSLGTAPRCYNSQAITFPVEFAESPCAIVGSVGGYSTIVNSSYFNLSATGMTLFLTCSEKDLTRNVRWLAIGKKKG